MAAPRVEFDIGLSALRVSGRPFPLHIVEAAAALAEGEALTITKTATSWTADFEVDAKPGPTPSQVGTTKRHKQKVRPLSTKKLNVVWPPERATAEFPDILKVNGKLPNEPLEDEVGGGGE